MPITGTNLFYLPLHFQGNCFKILIDTGAFSSALSKTILQNITLNKPACVTKLPKNFPEKVYVADGKKVRVLGKVLIELNVGLNTYSEEFLVLDQMSTAILGNPFFIKNQIVIDPSKKLLYFPDVTLSLNSIGNQGNSRQQVLITVSKITLKPNYQDIVEVSILKPDIAFKNAIGIIEPSSLFEKKSSLCVTSSINKLDSQRRTKIGILNLNPFTVTISPRTQIAKFIFLTPNQANYIDPIEPSIISSITENKIFNENKRSSRTWIPTDNFLFPTPENCHENSKLTGVWKKIYDTVVKLRQDEKLDPTVDKENRTKFLSKFDWTDSIFSHDQKKHMENLLVKYHKIFARHRLDLGKNTDCPVKLTPEHNRPIYSPNPATPIHLRDELIVELALMQYYDIITTLPFSRYSSPIFAQRKSSGKLRILIDLRRINHLLRHDYNNNNYPIPTMADATAHLAGKTIFAKMDCSQAYFSMQMADNLSVQLLAFNFGGRTFAFKRLAQGLSRSPTAFSSCVSKHLQSCVASDKCFVYFDDLGSGANDGNTLIDNLEQIFRCIQSLGFKLSIEKCQFGIPKIRFLGHELSAAGIRPNKPKVEKFLANVRMPKTIKQVRRLIGFMQYFFKLLRKESEFNITNNHHESLATLKNDLIKACSMSLKLAQPGCQFIIVCDASFYAAGFILLIEDNLECEELNKDKTDAPVSFGSHLFSPAQLKHSIYAKEFLGIYLAFESFEHYIWGVSTKPVIVLTDNKSVTRFFQTKKLPGNLWNAVDYVLSFNFVLGHISGKANAAADYLSRIHVNFVLGHISGKANAAADYLSRIHVNPNTKLKLKLSDRIPIRDIKVEVLAQTPDNSLTTLTTAVHVPLITIDSEETCSTIELNSFIEPKDQSINKLSEEHPLDKFELSECLKAIDMFNEQSKDQDIQKALNWLKKKEPPISTYGSYDLQKYHKQLSRLILDGNILCRKFYDHSGRNFIKQIVIPKQLRTELIYRIHNSKLKGRLGIQKTIHEFRRKFYFPGYTEFLITYINNCPTCLQAKSPKHETLTMPLSPVSSNTSLPADMLQIDIVGQLPKSGGYSYILTGMDVFSKYMFAQPLTSISAETVCKFLMQWFMRHSYIPIVILRDQGTQFTSRMLGELSTLLEFKIEHATVKHAQSELWKGPMAH